MSVLDFSAPPAAANPTSGATGRRAFGASRTDANGQPLPKAKLWLNVGYDAGDRVITTPLGLAIDTMQPNQIRGQNQDYVEAMAAGNDLLEMLQKAGFGMQPGERREVNLKVYLQRVNEDIVVEKSQNRFGFDPAALLAPAPAAAE